MKKAIEMSQSTLKKKNQLLAILLIITSTTLAQNTFPKHQLSINAFRNPSIGLEYQQRHLSVHDGYYVTNLQEEFLLAQAELFATVIPDFPVIDSAGFIGSTLWIIWLLIIGIIIQKNIDLTDEEKRQKFSLVSNR